MWAKIVSLIASVVKPLIAWFIYMAGKRAASAEIAAEQAKKDAALAEDFLKNHDGRTPDDTLEKIKKGEF